jgi:hypothetical protein
MEENINFNNLCRGIAVVGNNNLISELYSCGDINIMLEGVKK